MPSVDFRLLLVTDRTRVQARPFMDLLAEAINAGLPAIQLRERDLSTRELLRVGGVLRAMAAPRGVCLLINDRVDLAMTLGLTGVHLRANSLPIPVVRRLVGSASLIGQSTHSLAEVRAASQQGADYIVFGPVFDTPSKRPYGSPLGLDQLAEACRISKVPVFAIGGVTTASVPIVRQAGAYGVAVIGAVLNRVDVGEAIREFMAVLETPTDSDGHA
ncbi:MAG: thiamine phosphate synthase [Nitrospira sp.]|nr:thiamine phosphate synthase [Nitrospira sp.]